MSTVTTLDYNKRFGAEAQRLAADARRQVADANAGSAAGATKYSKWFFGEENSDGQKIVKPKLRPIDIANMKAAEIATITLSNLGILGDENFDLFTSKLPGNHKMNKHIHASLIAKDVAPWLGQCKIGEVRGERINGLTRVQQFFLGNFDAEINTSGQGSLYQVKNRDFNQVFYGLHMLIGDDNKFKGFDRSMGSDGIAFQTGNMNEAFYAIASAAMGKSIQELREMAARAAAMKRAA